MPDRRRHRGAHPDDEGLFAATAWPGLRLATGELSWLLSRGYAPPSALKLVGDRHRLASRQRDAVRRSACSDAALAGRLGRLCSLGQLHGATLHIDGFNVLISIEAALSHGALFVGRDGAIRDLASMHGAYRKVEETMEAVDLILMHIWEAGVEKVRWLLDAPVSNSGKLGALIEERTRTSETLSFRAFSVNTERHVDEMLRSADGVIASADSAVLDDCCAWVNLASEIVRDRVPGAWLIDMRTG